MDQPIAPLGLVPILPANARSSAYSSCITQGTSRPQLYGQYGDSTSTYGQPSGQQTAYYQQGTTGLSSQPRKQGGKKQQGGRGPPGDGGGSHRRGKDKDPDKEQPNVLWACPFVKRDRRSNLRCLKYELRRIVDVRQHIRRYHLQPLHCPRCGVVFEDESTYNEHVRRRSCRAIAFVMPGVTKDQWDRIGERGETKGSGNNHERRWYKIWEILFPGVPTPDSPYAASEFAERMAYASQQLRDRGDIQKLLSFFPADQHQNMRQYTDLLLSTLRNYAEQQDGASGFTASPLANPEVEQSVSRPSTSQGTPFETSVFPGTGPNHFQVYSQGYDTFDPNNVHFDDPIEIPQFTWPAGFAGSQINNEHDFSSGYPQPNAFGDEYHDNDHVDTTYP